MSPENFIYWLQGFYELTPEDKLTPQMRIIKEHLALVFNKVTPDIVPEKLKKETFDGLLEKIKTSPSLSSFPPAQWPAPHDWTFRPEAAPRYCNENPDLLNQSIC
jgi:hypothetical protein